MNLSTAQDIVYNGQTVDSVYYGSTLIWPIHDYSQDYFTLEVVGAQSSFRFHPVYDPTTGTSINYNMEYSLDNGVTWNNMPDQDYTPLLTTGEKIICRGIYIPSSPTSSNIHNFGTFSATGDYKVYGNIMSLIYGDNFVGKYDLTEKSCRFTWLFHENSTLIDAKDLVLPATTLTDYCYHEIFAGCTNLVNTPSLPATTLEFACYNGMFYNCTSLTTAPLLPATTLAQSCYNSMFRNCTSLIAAPLLPAQIIINGSYSGMFDGCTSLSSITCLATQNYNGTNNWVRGVAQSGTFTKAATMIYWSTGDSGIPSGWTVSDYSE